MEIHLNRATYRCIIPKCQNEMEDDSPLCTHHLDNHEEYGHPYGKEVNSLVDFYISKGADRIEAMERTFEKMKNKGEKKGLTYKRIQQFHIAKSQLSFEKRRNSG